MFLTEKHSVQACFLEVVCLELCIQFAKRQSGVQEGRLELESFDRHRVILQSGVDLKENRLRLGCVLFESGILEHFNVKVHARNSCQVEIVRCDVHSNQTLFGIDSFVEVEHP